MCQIDSSNLTHTVCFDVSIYHIIGEPDVTNERMTHLLKLDTVFHTHDARIMTHDASRIRTTHRVDLALEYDTLVSVFVSSFVLPFSITLWAQKFFQAPILNSSTDFLVRSPFQSY